MGRKYQNFEFQLVPHKIIRVTDFRVRVIAREVNDDFKYHQCGAAYARHLYTVLDRPHRVA